jgi:hypothetical protein
LAIGRKAMEVIYTTDLSRPGNDVYIYESVSLIKQFELYAVIKVYRVVGWSEREEVSVLYTSLSRSSAVENFERCGGII